MKKHIVHVLTIMMLFCFMTTVYAAQEVTILLNGEKIEFVQNKPFIFSRDNRVVVPIEEMAKIIGAEMTYDEKENIVTFSKKYDVKNGAVYDNFFDDGKEWLTQYEVSFQRGESAYWVSLETSDENGNVTGNGEWFAMMDCTAIYDDAEIVYVPVKYVAEEFGYTVAWDAKTKTVSLSDNNAKPIVHKLGSKQHNIFLSEVRENIEVLSDCVEEMFCADVDWEKHYFAVYDSEEAYNNGDGLPALLYDAKGEAPKGNYFKDPTESDYYIVNNFKSNEEVRHYLREYLSDSVINKWFNKDFLEYDGNLYLRRGSRGYGAVVCHPHSAKFLEQKDGKYYVTVDFLYFSEFDHTETLEFTKIGGNWIMTKEDE